MSSHFVPAVGAPQNRLLAALPASDWKRVKRYLSVLETAARETLCELESRLDYAYFPTTSIISVRHVANDGASTEVATIGNEGVVGVSLIMGGGTTANRVVVQNDGEVYRLKREILQDEFSRGGYPEAVPEPPNIGVLEEPFWCARMRSFAADAPVTLQGQHQSVCAHASLPAGAALALRGWRSVRLGPGSRAYVGLDRG